MRFPGRGAHVIECTPDACMVVPIPKSQGGSESVQKSNRNSWEFPGVWLKKSPGRRRRGASNGSAAGAAHARAQCVGVRSD